ncbi:MAG: hypothetical protein GY729_15850 [Desulfobacteraceae bacterium]|nr:hypothetical protein [Desulfobacteraceae bacterium]
MDVKYINPFINASINVFKTFAQITPVPGKASVRIAPSGKGEIKSFIGLNGHGVNGYFIINFSQDCLNDIFKALFGEAESANLEELDDIAGELTNMISGGAKAELSEKGFFFDVAVPQISRKIPKIPANLKKTPIIVVPFETGSGSFLIEASLIKIEKDFEKDTSPKIKPPNGMISIEEFSKRTGMGKIKVRRFLTTGFLSGEKVSALQWHIPKIELEKIQGGQTNSIPKTDSKKEGYINLSDYVSVKDFVKETGLPSAKIKGLLRSGFLIGKQDGLNKWHVRKDQISKLK